MKVLLTILILLIPSLGNAETIRAVYRNDGGVSITTPQCDMEKVGLSGLSYEDFDDSQLPSKDFRDAWTGEKGKGVWVDEKKKKEILNQRNKKDADPTASAAAAGAAAGAAAALGAGGLANLKKKKDG